MTSWPRRVTRRCVTVAVAVLSVNAGLAAFQARPPADVTGAWVMTVEMSMGTASPTIDVKQDGGKLSGVYVSRYGDYPISGSVTGRAITFSILMRPDDPVTITYTGELSPDGRQMRGTADLGEMGDATWHAERTR